MLDLIRDFFRNDEDHASPTLDPSMAAQALLFEVVWADHEIETDEVNALESAISQTFGLSLAEVQARAESVKALHDQAVGLHEFTQALNEHLDQSQKYQVVLAMWQVALADQHIDALEEHIIRRAADLLYVSHSRFIEAKRTAKDLQEGRSRER